MRINGSNGVAATLPASTAAAARRTAGGGFAVAENETLLAAGAATALRTVGGIDALIALQGVEDPAERRRQAARRGGYALDALDELKLGLLGGGLSPATLTKLKSAAGYLKDTSGDAGLDSVLGEIELRVEVEIAKLAPR
jgi:Class II flagellar assembly regulator